MFALKSVNSLVISVFWNLVKVVLALDARSAANLEVAPIRVWSILT